MINKITLSLTLLMLCGLSAAAQHFTLSGKLKAESNQKCDIMLITSEGGHQNITNEGGHFTADVTPSGSGFYQMCVITTGENKRQYFAPVYLPAKVGAKYTVNLDVTSFPMNVSGSADNEALAAYGAVVINADQAIYAPSLPTDAEVKTLLDGYKAKADSIVNRYACSAPVKEYISVWAYLSAKGGHASLRHRFKRDNATLSVPLTLPAAETALDNDVANEFSLAPLSAMEGLPKGSLDERIGYLNAHYKNKTLKDKVRAQLIERYLVAFDYANHYDEGLAELTALSKKYNLGDDYVKQFAARRYTIEGAAFPKANIVDANGKAFNINDYRGSYVYIDLWASWCVPCCKEVPHLQALEKMVTNPNVKFVSISIDSNETAWRNKMKQLNCEGLQFITKDKSFTESLNITGIPHFLIYDYNGNLLNYSAPRPSAGQQLADYLNALKK